MIRLYNKYLVRKNLWYGLKTSFDSTALIYQIKFILIWIEPLVNLHHNVRQNLVIEDTFVTLNLLYLPTMFVRMVCSSWQILKHPITMLTKATFTWKRMDIMFAESNILNIEIAYNPISYTHISICLYYWKKKHRSLQAYCCYVSQ